MLKRICLILLLMASVKGSAQTGGLGVFKILEIPMHSMALAWSGYLISQPNADILQTTNNPAMLDDQHKFKAGMSAGSILPGVFSANAVFGCGNSLISPSNDKNINLRSKLSGKMISWQGYAQHIDYGSMMAYDAGGNLVGKVGANESNFGVVASMGLTPNFRVGAQLGAVYSVLGPYIGNGVYVNLGLNYIRTDKTLSAGLVIKNLGTQISSYQGAGREVLPFNIQGALAILPKHMPLKFHLVAHDLQKWDLTYNQYVDNQGQIDLNGKLAEPKKAGFSQMLIRHIALGTELVLGKNFSLLIGYNHQRRYEMTTLARKGTSGFGWGLKFRVSKFDITYSSASYFPSQNSNMFSVVFSPMQFFNRSKITTVGTPSF